MVHFSDSVFDFDAPAINELTYPANSLNCVRLKDGVELAASDRVKFLSPDSRTFILLVSRVEESDVGVYECRATNKVASQSSKATLIITGLTPIRLEPNI